MFNKIKIIVFMCGKESKHYKLAVSYYGQAQKEWDANKKKKLLENALAELDKAFEDIEQDENYKSFRNTINTELDGLSN